MSKTALGNIRTAQNLFKVGDELYTSGQKKGSIGSLSAAIDPTQQTIREHGVKTKKEKSNNHTVPRVQLTTIDPLAPNIVDFNKQLNAIITLEQKMKEASDELVGLKDTSNICFSISKKNLKQSKANCKFLVKESKKERRKLKALIKQFDVEKFSIIFTDLQQEVIGGNTSDDDLGRRFFKNTAVGMKLKIVQSVLIESQLRRIKSEVKKRINAEQKKEIEEKLEILELEVKSADKKVEGIKNKINYSEDKDLQLSNELVKTSSDLVKFRRSYVNALKVQVKLLSPNSNVKELLNDAKIKLQVATIDNDLIKKSNHQMNIRNRALQRKKKREAAIAAAEEAKKALKEAKEAEKQRKKLESKEEKAAARLKKLASKEKEAAEIRKERFSTNKEKIRLYWNIGNKILERQRQEGWSRQVIKKISKDLRSEFPEIQGLSYGNISYMRQFVTKYRREEFLQQAIGEIPWGHNITIFSKIKTLDARLWYAKKTLENGWSRRVLSLQIQSNLYTKDGKSTNNSEAISDFEKKISTLAKNEGVVRNYLRIMKIIKPNKRSSI